MGEKVNASIDANYSDRKIHHNANYFDVEFSSDTPKKMWFNIPLGENMDDYITVSFRIDDLMEAIGKALVREYDEDD